MIRKGRVDEPRKDDTSRNADGLEFYIRRQRKRENNLFPLRISSTTTIYVTQDKCNEKYAEQYMKEKMGIR